MAGSHGFGRRGARGNPTQRREGSSFNGVWDGVVEDDQDPEQLGRVRVRIFDLHDEDVPIEQLPWAMPNFPVGFVHLSDPDRNGGFFHVPPVDSLVNVMFRHGDPEHPVWFGGWFPGNHPIRGREGYSNHQKRQTLYGSAGVPSCPTWATLRGMRIELDDEAGELRITTPKGHKCTLSDSEANEHGDCIKMEDHKGNYIWMHSGMDRMDIYWNGDCFEHITGDYHQKIDGQKVVHVDGDVSESYGGIMHTKVVGDRNLDTDGVINHNCGQAQPVPVNLPEPGTASGGDVIGRVLESLGQQIRKIVTGG